MGKKLYIPIKALNLLTPFHTQHVSEDEKGATPFDVYVAACIYTWKSVLITPEAVSHTLCMSYHFSGHRNKSLQKVWKAMKVLKKHGILADYTLTEWGQIRILMGVDAGGFYTALDTDVLKLPRYAQVVYLALRSIKTPILHWKDLVYSGLLKINKHHPRKAIFKGFEELLRVGIFSGEVRGPYLILTARNQEEVTHA